MTENKKKVGTIVICAAVVSCLIGLIIKRIKSDKYYL